VIFFWCATSLAQQASEPADLPLDALLNTRISTAAKYEQRVTDVPASVTVITSEEITRNGWHTLAEALASIRGVHLTYDRGYTYLGVRGVGLPTDFNNRFLILLNGQPMVDGVSGSIDTGTALAIDLSALQRIEFVRGPGSVLYGSGAMFGVINLVLKSEQEAPSLTAGEGSHHTTVASGRFGQNLGAGFSMSVTGALQNDHGQNLYFPEFDTPAANAGLSVGHDYDNYRSLIATVAGHGLQLLALTSSRTKGIPTSWFGTTFNRREQLTDGRTLLSLTGDRRLSTTGQLSGRVSFDRFDYHGQFPYGDDLWRDRSSSTRLDADVRYVLDLRPNHRLTFGSEYVDNVQANYKFGTAGNEQVIGKPFSVVSVYGQSEFQPFHSVSVTAGLRYDHYAGVANAVNPSAAVVWHVNASNTFKAIYGRAFRLPTVYELGFEDSTQQFIHSDDLQPERIRQTELMWEGRLSPAILLSASGYRLRMTNLIGRAVDPVTEEAQFRNSSTVTSSGLELQADYRDGEGMWSYVSYARQHADEDGVGMVNSPANLVKAGISTSTARPIQGALEVQYTSGRKTFGGKTTPGVALTNMTLSAALWGPLRLSLSVRNVLDVAYATPGGRDHPEDTIPQDGRTFLLKLRLGGQ
jgi:outer membrane receptor protein involved in Fe transport